MLSESAVLGRLSGHRHTWSIPLVAVVGKKDLVETVLSSKKNPEMSISLNTGTTFYFPQVHILHALVTYI